MAIADQYVPGRPVDFNRPFLLSDRDYRVVDGDTIAILGPESEGRRSTIMRLRFRSIAAPEKRKNTSTHEDILDRAFGDDIPSPSSWHPGDRSRDVLKKVCSGYSLHIKTSGRDKYGRILCDITRSGVKSADFEVQGAQSLEILMIRKHASTQFVHEDRRTGEKTPEPLPREFPFEGVDRRPALENLIAGRSAEKGPSALEHLLYGEDEEPGKRSALDDLISGRFDP